MVDPNPARGMPLALQRYWLVGKGGIKIRWNVPGDFLRCVRHLTKYFPKDPKGLCNILHTKATGGPPGHGSLEIRDHHHSLTAATQLLAAQPQLGPLWSGPIAPIGRLTEEVGRKRIFEHGALKSRSYPLPLRYRKVDLGGHTGAITVARIFGHTIGPDEKGRDTLYAWGDWLDPDIVPEVKEAKYMVDQGVTGASLDPGGPVVIAVDPNTGIEHTTDYTMGGATLVSTAAFDGMRLYNLDGEGHWPDEDPDMAMAEEEPDCCCMAEDAGITPPFPVSSPALITMPPKTPSVYAVNTGGWHGLPLAPRDAVFDNDEAVQRIAAWAAGDESKLNQAFMWRDPKLPGGAIESYRLPLGDIINGKLTLVFHAIYAAAALISGAHGGLPGISDEEKNQIRGIISAIYPEMARAFNDPNIRAPWDRPAEVAQQQQGGQAVTAAANEPYGDVAYADPGYLKDGKKRYPLNSEERCKAAWSYINQQDNASQYTPAQLKAIRGRIIAALKKYGVNTSEPAAPGSQMAASKKKIPTKKTPMLSDGDSEYALTDEGYPLEPPRAWFDDPKLTQPTPLTVTPEGQVYGHLAAWGVCHRDVGNKDCVLAPKSKLGYDPFHLGQVFTAEGDTLRVGKVVQDTRHASILLGYSAAALHYDDTGDEVAVVRAGEDQFGIWLAGSVVPEATRSKVAKLRRSPLSGDWRAVNGNLELTAALAVNVPAFPVYAMDNEERMALVAAGVIYAGDVSGADNDVPLIGDDDGTEVDFVEADDDNVDELDEEQEDRAWELRELLEVDELLTQEKLGQELAQVFAAETQMVAPPAAPPATTTVPMATPPVTGMPDVTPATDASADPFSPGAIAARQENAQFSVIAEAGGGTDHPAPAPKQLVVPPAPQQAAV